VDNESECAICKEVFTDPRVLPCVHTFCLKCIQGWRQTSRRNIGMSTVQKRINHSGELGEGIAAQFVRGENASSARTNKR